MHNLKDFGAYLDVAGPGVLAATAGGTGDATAQTGAIVDQRAAKLRSGLAVVFGSADLADTKTLSLLIKIEHGDDSGLSDAADYDFGGDPGTLGVVATGDTGGTTEAVAAAIRIDLTGVKRYWRVSVTPDLSATATDTFDGACGVVACGESAPLTA